MIRRWERLILRRTLRYQRPAAWTLLVGAGVTFFGVVFDVIRTGDAKWATLLVAADIFIGGAGELRDVAEHEEGDQ